MGPRISIITSTYNSEKTLARTINSIINQTLPRFEYIIVDGGSNDKTINIVKKFEPKLKARNIEFKWISEKDSGIYEAWNKGIEMTSGDWIGFLGSDDILLNGALQDYSDIISNTNDVDFISSKVKVVQNGKVLKLISEPWDWNKFKKFMNVAHVGAMHSKLYFDKHGLFNENYRIAGDYELLLRAKEKLKYCFLDKITAEMETGGISNDQGYNTLYETRNAKINILKENKFMAHLYFIWALFKYKIKSTLNWK